MATYRLEAWLYHKDQDLEDELEERVKGAFKDHNIGYNAGPVVFRIYPNGDPGGPDPYYPSNTNT